MLVVLSTLGNVPDILWVSGAFITGLGFLLVCRGELVAGLFFFWVFLKFWCCWFPGLLVIITKWFCALGKFLVLIGGHGRGGGVLGCAQLVLVSTLPAYYFFL